MALTTLPVRLVQMIETATCPSAAFRIIVFGIWFLTVSIVPGCGSGGDSGDPSGRTGSGGDTSATGPASASLAWDPVSSVFGYYIHYGTQSPGSPGSCAYTQSVFSATPTATVTGLEAGTTYYFAVSSYNGVESVCSGEISTVTSSA